MGKGHPLQPQSFLFDQCSILGDTISKRSKGICFQRNPRNALRFYVQYIKLFTANFPFSLLVFFLSLHSPPLLYFSIKVQVFLILQISLLTLHLPYSRLPRGLSSTPSKITFILCFLRNPIAYIFTRQPFYKGEYSSFYIQVIML